MAKGIYKEFDEVELGKKRPLGNLPVLVLSSEPVAGEHGDRARSGAAALLDVLSLDTVHMTATGSGHEIHLYQPAIVVDAIMQDVYAAREHVPLYRARAFGTQ
ncbi:MAG: hypothetical protein JO099_07310 [Acidobacteriia bacterium]|nr:hypothetical protein [Terriglobia bacterium]